MLNLHDDDNGDEERQPRRDIPWQVKAIGQIGIPGVIALALLYVLMGDRGRWIDKTDEDKVLEQVQTQISREHIEQLNTQWLQLRLLRQICLNGSHTDQQRLACVSERGDQR